MLYRIRYVSDGGPVRRDNPRGWPAWSRNYQTMLAALRALRDVVNTDERVGNVLGVALQYKISGGAWIWMSARATDRHATDMRISNWTVLDSIKRHTEVSQ